jgi:alkanesulfonate monooxygenase SsuD/methylene tetrahydromethanopterin reductase-like flavin-dependent oxidoreductase (luciferase family)
MKIGIFDHMDRSGAPLAEQYENRLKLIEAYDRAGIYAYHLAEHHSTPLGMAPSPSAFLAAVSQRTKRLRFGPLVYTLSLHHPLRVVEELCMLDHLSNGRLELGIGRGVSQHEISYYSVDPAEAQPRYFEAYDILLKALASETLTYQGRFYSFKDTPIVFSPLQKPHPPLWYGVVNAEGAAWAAKNAINVVCNAPAPAIRQMTDRYRAEWTAAGHAGSLPLMAMNRYTVLAQSDAEAVAIARRAYARWYSSFAWLWQKHGTQPPNVAYPDNYDDAQKQGYAIAGTPETVRTTLARQLAESGANYLICRFAFGDLTLEESLHSLALFQASVMPAFARMREAAE